MKIRKKKKITKEEIKKDRFEEVIFSIFDSFKKEPGKWSGGIILAIVAVFLIIFLTQRRITRSFQGEKIFIQALSYLNAGDFGNAENLFKQVYEGARGSFEGSKALYYLGHLNMLKGNFDEAERYFKEYLSSKPHDDFFESAAEEALAVIYFNKRDKGKMLEHIELAIKKAPFKFQKSYYFLRKIEMLKEIDEDAGKILQIIEKEKNMWENTVWEHEISGLREYFEGKVAIKGG